MMTRRFKLLAALSLPLITMFPGLARAEAPIATEFAGRWGGILGPPATGLRIVLVIDGSAAPVLISVDQGGVQIPSTGGNVSGDRLELVFARVRGQLSVSRSSSADGVATLTGTWSQGRAMPITLTLLRDDQAAPERPLVQRGALANEVAAALSGSGLPALGAAWARGGQSGIATTGLRAIGQTATVTDNDRWHMGSITKSMTATLLARLVAQSKLGWDSTVTGILGSAITNIHADLADITLHELVTGRSGIATNPPMLELLTYPRREVDPRTSRLRWARSMLERAPEGRPRQSFIYPNTGFVIAGAMAEIAAGKAWETLMNEEVFVPLGLTSAGFGAPDSQANPSGHTTGLMRRTSAVVSTGASDNPAVMGPAGTIHMTLQDLASFARTHAEGHTGRASSSYLSADAWRFLHTPPAGSDYACGLVKRSDGTLWHNGSNTMWYGEMLIDPSNGTGAAAVANLASNETAVAAVLDAARQEAGRSAG
jgi:CubicO group peptidase (beta-lactamase class C family)